MPGIAVLVAFYIIYFIKLISQKRKGIKTDQMAIGRKDSKAVVIEMCLKCVSVLIVFCQLFSIYINRTERPGTINRLGIAAAAAGTVIFAAAVVAMRDSWRAGIPADDETELVTGGIYRVSRNPAFFGFDLLYLGILAAYPSTILAVVTLYAIIIFHLQILEEEKFLRGRFGDDYHKYESDICRYFGRRKFMTVFFTVIMSAAVIFAVSTAAINLHMVMSAKKNIISIEQASSGTAYDCILVLGCKVKSNKTPSNMLQDRLDVSIDLYNNGVSDKLLMSGDHGTRYYDEVDNMKKVAVEDGVPSYNIFMDHAGFSTYESMYRARDIFRAKRVLIVTQGYHLSRAVYIARALGMDADGVACDLHSYGGQRYRDIREVLARDKAFIYTLIMPEPTYMGGQIPITGNGDDTNDEDSQKFFEITDSDL